MQAPTSFVYATAERLLEAETGKRKLPHGMMRRELNDIMDMTHLLSQLLDSWLFGLEASGTAPSDHYIPQQTDLNDIADSTARIMIQFCRRFAVPRENIRVIGRFPVLYIDPKAATQVFMNIMVNAIKYSFQTKDFQLRISAETVTLDELASTQIDPRVLDQTRSPPSAGRLALRLRRPGYWRIGRLSRAHLCCRRAGHELRGGSFAPWRGSGLVCGARHHAGSFRRRMAGESLPADPFPRILPGHTEKGRLRASRRMEQ